MASWPGTLPAYVERENYREIPPNLALRFESDSGAVITRQRHTAGPTRFEMIVWLTAAQVDTFLAFYTNTVAGGSEGWDWVHPRTQAAATFHFLGSPVVSPLGEEYRVRFNAEIRP